VEGESAAAHDSRGLSRAANLRQALARRNRASPSTADRARAADDRESAAADRARAAQERERASVLRAEAARDRAEAVRERNLAGIDQLTGVHLRGIGLDEVEREIGRVRRTGAALTLAFVDVNNLKAVNDTEGHLAGDVLLRAVADTLRTMLRPYDVIVRFGGDEFICALSNIDSDAAGQRFSDIVASLARNGHAHAISFGFAEFQEDDDLERLLDRADSSLIKARELSGHRLRRA
jgi:diguanylate cyclase (GGDEF)-like protein